MITGFQRWLNYESTTTGAGRRVLRVAVILVLLRWCGFALAQSSHDRLQGIAHSASLTFMMKDGTCVAGPISKIDPKTVLVQQYQKPPLVIHRSDLIQVSQGDALVYSARSSWTDVQAVHLLSHESFVLKARNGKVVKGRPLWVTANSVVFKRGLWMKKRYGKDQIVTVDYLRMKPESDAFDYFAQEAPAMLFFYPEFYDRLAGMEGRIPVRLYDAVQPEDDAPLKCSWR